MWLEVNASCHAPILLLPRPIPYQILSPHVEVPRVAYEKLTDKREGERSADVHVRVQAAREVQARRFAAQPHLTCNADMWPAEVCRYCAVEPAAQPLLRAASQRQQLSAHASHRVLKLTRTIAYLAGDC